LGKEGIRTFARSSDKAVSLPPLLAAVVELPAFVYSQGEAGKGGMLAVLRFAAQIWAAPKELHGNLSQEYFLPRGELKRAGTGAPLPRSRNFREVSVATAESEPVS